MKEGERDENSKLHPVIHLDRFHGPEQKILFLLSDVVQVLICRNYRGDVDMSEIEHFMPILMDKEEEGNLSPILAHGGVRFLWIKHKIGRATCRERV